MRVSTYFEKGGRQDTPAYVLSDLSPGHTVSGPTLLIDKISCIVVRIRRGSPVARHGAPGMSCSRAASVLPQLVLCVVSLRCAAGP